jgi:hypothetical protein
MDVSVGGSVQAPTIELKSGFFSFGHPAFSRLEVFSYQGGRNEKWRVEAPNGQCDVGASAVVYGQTPQHFRQMQRAAPLKEGVIYVIVVDGCGSTGAASFKIDRGSVAVVEEGLSSIPARTIRF